jgi:hypothetical protein
MLRVMDKRRADIEETLRNTTPSTERRCSSTRITHSTKKTMPPNEEYTN